jgi:hypothetical protein
MKHTIEQVTDYFPGLKWLGREFGYLHLHIDGVKNA